MSFKDRKIVFHPHMAQIGEAKEKELPEERRRHLKNYLLIGGLFLLSLGIYTFVKDYRDIGDFLRSIGVYG